LFTFNKERFTRRLLAIQNLATHHALHNNVLQSNAVFNLVTHLVHLSNARQD
jgi:hypothetical protein